MVRAEAVNECMFTPLWDIIDLMAHVYPCGLQINIVQISSVRCAQDNWFYLCIKLYVEDGVAVSW